MKARIVVLGMLVLCYFVLFCLHAAAFKVNVLLFIWSLDSGDTFLKLREKVLSSGEWCAFVRARKHVLVSVVCITCWSALRLFD